MTNASARLWPMSVQFNRESNAQVDKCLGDDVDE